MAERRSKLQNQKHVTTACLSCRAAKAKCDGKQPCQACTNRHRECLYGDQPDHRRILKRDYEQLCARSDLLDTIVESLRMGDSKSNEALLQIIRSGATIDEIMQYVTDNPSRAKRTKRNVLDIVYLTDQPLVSVPAQPWTNVVQDDEAVSHLVSAYFAWNHPTYPILDRDIFVREMKLSNVSSQFCSQFLVNAILCIGCTYTDHPAAFAQCCDNSTRGLHFFREAMRLWECSEGEATLTNLQGLVAMLCCTFALGKDRIGLLYTPQLTALRRQFTMKVRKKQKVGSRDYVNQEFKRAYALAVWGSFNIEVEVSMAWRQPASLHEPHVPYTNIYSSNELRAIEQWRPYPKPDPEVPFCSKSLELVRFSLYEIGKDICSVLLSGSPDDSPLPGHIILGHSEKLLRAQDIEHELVRWCKNLPQTLKAENLEDSYIAGPVLDLHLTYSVWRITLYGVLLQCDSESPQPVREGYNQEILSACARIANIIQGSHRGWGLSAAPFSLVHSASVGAHVLLDFLHHPNVPAIFHTMIIALTASCHLWVLARGIVRTLWLTLIERKIQSLLPDSTLNLLKLHAVEKWGPEDHQLFASCAYPSYTLSDNSRYPVGIGELLESYEQLDLGHMNQSESSSRAPV